MALVDIYKVTYTKGSNKHPAQTTDYVAAAAGSGAVALAALIKTQNGDGLNVTVIDVLTIRKGVVS